MVVIVVIFKFMIMVDKIVSDVRLLYRIKLGLFLNFVWLFRNKVGLSGKYLLKCFFFFMIIRYIDC